VISVPYFLDGGFDDRPQRRGKHVDAHPDHNQQQAADDQPTLHDFSTFPLKVEKIVRPLSE